MQLWISEVNIKREHCSGSISGLESDPDSGSSFVTSGEIHTTYLVINENTELD